MRIEDRIMKCWNIEEKYLGEDALDWWTDHMGLAALVAGPFAPHAWYCMLRGTGPSLGVRVLKTLHRVGSLL